VHDARKHLLELQLVAHLDVRVTLTLVHLQAHRQIYLLAGLLHVELHVELEVVEQAHHRVKVEEILLPRTRVHVAAEQVLQGSVHGLIEEVNCFDLVVLPPPLVRVELFHEGGLLGHEGLHRLCPRECGLGLQFVLPAGRLHYEVQELVAYTSGGRTQRAEGVLVRRDGLPEDNGGQLDAEELAEIVHLVEEFHEVLF